MLYEIWCDKFISNGSPRGIIHFNEKLNIVKGHDSGTNSIGKSTFLLAIDFAFGGNSYAEDKRLIKKIGHHLINYCFKFNDDFYYFSRNTAQPKEVNICDADYTVNETISIDEYNNKLLALYGINLPHISFRQIVGRYFRVYGRGSSNERKPLASYDGEAPKDSLIALLKLFNGYTPIEKLFSDIKEKEERKKAIINADKYNLVTIIKSKKDYQKNLGDIERLTEELQSLARFGRQELLYLAPEQAEEAAEYKGRYEALTRRKKQLWVKYYSVKNNAEKTHTSTAQDFESLLRFFPDSNIKLLKDIENFHSELTNILSDEFKNSMSELLKMINEISMELTQIEVLLKKLEVPKRIADSTLKAYAETQGQINELKKQNELYTEKKDIESDIRKQVHTKKIADTYSLLDFNSPETEKYLANEYESKVAKIFQRASKAASEKQQSISLSNNEYKLLVRFFVIMWRRNNIQLEKAKEMGIQLENMLKSLFGNHYKEMLKPEYKDYSFEKMFDEKIDVVRKTLYDNIIPETKDDDPTVLKTIRYYSPFIINNTSNIHFLLHNTYATLRYMVPKSQNEIYAEDIPGIMIYPISKTLCFCMLLSEKEIDTDKEEFNIPIEVWCNDNDIKLHFIDGYITQTAKSFIVDETNIDFIKNK